MRPRIRRSRLGIVGDLMRCGSRLIAGIAIGTSALMAQQLMDTVAAAANDLHRAGFTFGVSLFSTYISWNVNETPALNQGPPGGTFPDHFVANGVSLSLGWQKRVTEDSDFNIFYSPYYAYESNGVRSSSYTNLSPLRGTFALNWKHRLGRRWTLGLSGSVAAGNYGQLGFLPSSELSLASLPGSSADLAKTVLSGQGDGGSSAIIGPHQALLFGDTILSASADVSLKYAASPRLSFIGDVSANHMRHLNSSGDSTPYLLKESTFGSAALSTNYLIAPRTILFGNATYSRPFSPLVNSESGTALVGLGRSFTEHIFARASAGAGYTTSQDRFHSNSFRGTRTMYAVSGGYRLYSNTFVAGVNRSLSDYYGIGTTSLSVTGGWNWRKPGSDWGIQAGAAEFWLQGNIFGPSDKLSNGGFLANASMYRTLSHQLRVTLQYVYSSASLSSAYFSAVTGPPVHYSLQAVRLNVSWSPRFPGAGPGGAPPPDDPNAVP